MSLERQNMVYSICNDIIISMVYMIEKRHPIGNSNTQNCALYFIRFCNYDYVHNCQSTHTINIQWDLDNSHLRSDVLDMKTIFN